MLCGVLCISRKSICIGQCNPYEYINNLRLMIASEKIKIENVPIKKIALEVGFINPIQFRQQFKYRFGISPSQYRRIWSLSNSNNKITQTTCLLMTWL